MLGVNSYPQAYIDDIRGQVKRQLAAYRALANASRKAAGSSTASVDSALKKFEPIYFNGLVLNLEGYFVHRLRGVEGKDGNPLNEVRLLHLAHDERRRVRHGEVHQVEARGVGAGLQGR